MSKQKLDHQTLAGMKAPENPISIYDTVESGLMVRISKVGTKTFCYRYRFNGKNRRFTVGKFPGVSLSEARKKIQDLKAQINGGIDPQAEKKKRRLQPDPKTFEELTIEFKDKYLPTLRESTSTEYERIIDNELVPAFGKYPIKEISKNQIVNLLDDKAYNDASPTMANRIRARLSKIFNFAIERDLAEHNPVQNISTYKGGNTKRTRYYNEDEIKEIWKAIEQQPEPVQSVFKMLLITGQRKGETSRLKWEDIRGDVWTIPAEDSKNKQPHDVPLSGLALEVIENIQPLTGGSKYVFESPKKDDKPIEWLKRSVGNIKKHTETPNDFRIHDLRRTVATYMAKLGVERTVLGKILNHKGLAGDGQVTAIYDRHSYMEEKRRAMNRWSAYLQDILSEAKEANIYKLG